MANVRTYSPSVRVGNWNEDLCLEEDTLKDFLDKRDSGELLVQKTHNLLQNTLKKVDLSVTTDGLLHFGDTVMIVNPGAERNDVRDIRQRDPTALCLNISEYKAHLASQVEAPCPVSASRIIKPCIRNAFVITRTPFGYEYEVTAHMDLDSHRAEKETNHWVIITGTPTDDGRTMFDKPRPDPSGLTDRPMEGTGEIRNAGLDPNQTKPPPKTEEKPTMEEMLTQIEQTAKGGEAPLQTQ
uniref:Cilia- and flagella-associated protein 161 n=1 Tax=Branchiostoma floridae TaxID=7739 RepID=C3Z327_BRAFL|eukprot:XP_002597054.1 hypothetical protein BRAFLDRAFT_96207 [Branchiostoma floridae]